MPSERIRRQIDRLLDDADHAVAAADWALVAENPRLLPLLLEQVAPPVEVRNALAWRQWLELLDRPQPAWLPTS